MSDRKPSTKKIRIRLEVELPNETSSAATERVIDWMQGTFGTVERFQPNTATEPDEIEIHGDVNPVLQQRLEVDANSAIDANRGGATTADIGKIPDQKLATPITDRASKFANRALALISAEAAKAFVKALCDWLSGGRFVEKK